MRNKEKDQDQKKSPERCLSEASVHAASESPLRRSILPPAMHNLAVFNVADHFKPQIGLSSVAGRAIRLTAPCGPPKSLFKATAVDLGRHMPALGKMFSALSPLPRIDWKRLRERDEAAVRFAALNNWFIQMETPYPSLDDIVKSSCDVVELNRLLCEITTALLPSISQRLISDYPARREVLEEMFRLHAEKRYLASIPLALLSAEGITLDACNMYLFTEKGKREMAAWLNTLPLTELAKSLLGSISAPHPMSKSSQGESTRLSRHGVLHGRDLRYGSELFSLQAISILGFVGWAFASDGLVRDQSPPAQDGGVQIKSKQKRRPVV